MSRDKSDAEALEEALDDESIIDETLLENESGPLDEEIEAAESDDDLADADLEDGIDGDDDDDDAGDPREVPSGVRPNGDDEDDDEDEELEADLGEILKERLATEDEDDDEDDDEIGIMAGASKGSKQEDEIHCQSCFLLIKPSQFDTQGDEPACPHCGAPIG